MFTDRGCRGGRVATVALCALGRCPHDPDSSLVRLPRLVQYFLGCLCVCVCVCVRAGVWTSNRTRVTRGGRGANAPERGAVLAGKRVQRPGPLGAGGRLERLPNRFRTAYTIELLGYVGELQP